MNNQQEKLNSSKTRKKTEKWNWYSFPRFVSNYKVRTQTPHTSVAQTPLSKDVFSAWHVSVSNTDTTLSHVSTFS